MEMTNYNNIAQCKALAKVARLIRITYLYQKHISTVTGSKLELQKNRESKQLFKIKLPEIYGGQYYLFESQLLEGIVY